MEGGRELRRSPASWEADQDNSMERWLSGWRPSSLRSVSSISSTRAVLMTSPPRWLGLSPSASGPCSRISAVADDETRRQLSTRIVWAIVNEELQTLHVVAVLVQLGLEYIGRLVYRANVLGGGPLGRLSAGVP